MARITAVPHVRTGRLELPLRQVFRLLTSVRFALLIIALVAGGALLGVLFPQMQPGVRENATLRANFLQDQQARYGGLTPLLDGLQLFEVFHSAWFSALLVLLVAAISVCTVSRFPPIWRQIAHPQLRVADRYLDSARNRAAIDSPPPLDDVVRSLRRHHYRVVRVEDSPGGARLYADRFRWAGLATFASHLSLIVFLVGGLVTWRFGVHEDVLVAEGTTGPVFALDSGRHMQIEVRDFVRTIDPGGRERDIHTDLAVYRDGKLLAAGPTSINRPLKAAGYTFHQAAFFEDGAALEVREASTGRVVYSEVLPLTGTLPVPVLHVEDLSGKQLFDGPLPPTFLLQGLGGGAALDLPGGSQPIAVAVRQVQAPEGQVPWRLVVSGTGGLDDVGFGETTTLDGLRVTFRSLTASASATEAGIPGSAAGQWLVQMLRDGGQSSLQLVDPAGAVTRLAPGQVRQSGEYTYRFLGARSFSGITVKSDPGSGFIWIGAALLLGGLLCTFYVPRRRMWLHWEPARLRLAGIGASGDDLRRDAMP
ncbi:MAG: cytochrome c biogenesis protein ResB [Hyphomicrobiales bacterium]